MTKYAANTKVGIEGSKFEIEKIVNKYGASGFMYASQGSHAFVAFDLMKRRIKFAISLPDEADSSKSENGRSRTKLQAEKAHEQAVKQKWRSLVLTIKAKLVSVEEGIEVFDEAFMAQIQLPDGSTVGEFMQPQIEQAYTDSKMPPLLPQFT
ncbi:hypothetical protein KAR91_56070 [Candidatus Pacearchaeota archaeon]|nr:hypothetical protein [Candidatus Pacearchaeota archaeon]